MRKRLGTFLIERGLIRPEHLEEALILQQRMGVRLGTALHRQGHLTEAQLLRALGEFLNVPTVDLSNTPVDPAALAAVGARFAFEHAVFPVRMRVERGRRVLTVAMVDPLDVGTTDELGFVANARIESLLAAPSDVDRALRLHFGPQTGGVRGSVPSPIQLDQETSTMTIYRRGGTEEKINTSPTPSSGWAPPSAPKSEHPGTVGPRTPPAPAVAATWERFPRVSEQEMAPAPAERVEDADVMHAEPILSLSSSDVLPLSSPSLTSPGMVEALISKSGQTVDADLVLRMERRFWALMRILARQGIITKEDFLRELESDQGSNPPSTTKAS
ncbi:MAG: hypothetical protein ACFB9M_07660 [Myxococcota bacterium]